MKYFILSLSLLVVLVSCQKTADPSPTREDYLRSGKWKISKFAVTYKLTYPITYDSTTYDTISSCKSDDFLTFGPGFNGGINSGSSKCSASDPDIIPFTWEPVDNDKGVNIYGAGSMFGTNVINAVFKNFTQNSFTLSYFSTRPNALNANKMDTITYNVNLTNF